MNGLEAAAILHTMLPEMSHHSLHSAHGNLPLKERTKAAGIALWFPRWNELDVLLKKFVNF